jgi:hypothetical protein
VTNLQRQQVVRMIGADPQERPAGLMPAPIDQMADRGKMALLARSPAMWRGRGVGSPRGVDAGRLGAEQVQPRLQQMGHGKAGTVGERGLGGGQRIAAIEAKQAERALVVIARGCGGAA